MHAWLTIIEPSDMNAPKRPMSGFFQWGAVQFGGGGGRVLLWIFWNGNVALLPCSIDFYAHQRKRSARPSKSLTRNGAWPRSASGSERTCVKGGLVPVVYEEIEYRLLSKDWFWCFCSGRAFLPLRRLATRWSFFCVVFYRCKGSLPRFSSVEFPILSSPSTDSLIIWYYFLNPSTGEKKRNSQTHLTKGQVREG